VTQPKYSDEELAKMAHTAIQAGLRGDPRYIQLITTLAMVTHFSAAEIERRIDELASKAPAPA
jgi:hypothetical protein